MQASDIINRARYSLSDTDKTRWTDDRLLSCLNDALLDIALTTRVFNATIYMKLIKNIPIYDISDIAIRIERIEYLGTPLCKYIHEEMDREFGYRWKDVTGGIPTHIVYNLEKIGVFRIYPEPNFGDTVTIDEDTHLGIITDIDYSSMVPEFETNFGDIEDEDINKYITIYYTRMPKVLTSITDNLGILVDNQLASVLAHYVAGVAFRDNTETQNRQIGNEELTIYEHKKVARFIKKSFNNVERARVTKYNSMS